ncbi:MAG: radical SAM protein [Proteobacteria bacterium]|nr:radical SAM protein [Pseudomonadota bacterium]
MKAAESRYKTAYLIYPHYPGVPDNGYGKVTLATLAAMLCDQFELTVVDEPDCGLVDCDAKIDVAFLIALTGHEQRIAELYREFSSRGVLVVVGGPLATMSSELIRPHCDVLVKGEIDDVHRELFAEIASGDHKNEYVYVTANPVNSPLPRWDLLPSHHKEGTIQASRGCPYNCEFCLSSKYAGSKMRIKTSDQLLTEITNLYGMGYRYINFTDDNFTMHTRFAKQFLREMADWNSRQTLGECAFFMMASINATRDDELLELLRDANVRSIFIGIETPVSQSLLDSHKRHNLSGLPMVDKLRKFMEYGIMPSIGLTSGFDADPPDIFQRQLAFIREAGVPIVRCGLLSAIHNTDLYLRLKREGREVDDTFMQYPTWLNFEPRVMSRDRMQLGLRWLLSNAYAPSAYGDRVGMMVQAMLESERSKLSLPKNAENTVLNILEHTLQRLELLGAEEAEMAHRGRQYVKENKEVAGVVITAVGGYRHYRRINDKLGLYRPEYIGVDLDELFAAEAPESGRSNKQALSMLAN